MEAERNRQEYEISTKIVSRKCVTIELRPSPTCQRPKSSRDFKTKGEDVFHLSAVNQNSSHHSFVNTGRAKRKREDGTATDIPPNKVKRNNNDENTYSADNSLNTSLDSITASVYNRRQLPKSARGKINNNSSQPPIIITFSEKHNLLTNQEAINKINTDAIYKCDGKQLSILATNKSAHDEIVKFLADLQKSTQCFKCQRHGHRRTNCYREPKCMKCAENHLTSDCNRDENNLKYKCINCHGNNKANDKSRIDVSKSHQRMIGLFIVQFNVIY
ncbi:hypothetical protein PV328_010367 [Microctonus aethiopoides]|uniref:CCHC-type domain-containing protein n=1 Tax=Microctonus aethiopoides TaxID=144406 RepID=A0AA39FHR1_9HYME|nr:hypothetical protein PV328_010367 [Microctonus aethiopoides]